jgi:hypothetical protein
MAILSNVRAHITHKGLLVHVPFVSARTDGEYTKRNSKIHGENGKHGKCFETVFRSRFSYPRILRPAQYLSCPNLYRSVFLVIVNKVISC